MNKETIEKFENFIKGVPAGEDIVKVVILTQGKSDEFRYQTTYEWGD